LAPIRIGILGYGKISRDQHAPAIAANPDFHLTAVAHATGGDTPPGAQVFEGVDDLLAHGEIDAVAINTPPGPRRALAVQCLGAGKHVLLEKPPAATVAEVGAIADAAQAAGRTAFTTYHAQHNGAVARAAERLAGRQVVGLEVNWKEDVRRWHPGQDWVFDAAGFGVFDPGINALSVLTRILPARVFVTTVEMSIPKGRQGPIAAELALAMAGAPDGALRMHLDWRETGGETWTVAVTCADGLKLTLEKGGARLLVEGEPPFDGPDDQEYPDLYRTFADLVRQGRSQVDVAPFQLVADAFMVAKRTEVEAFSF
jgi:D-galactose 1-dehydrogenase